MKYVKYLIKFCLISYTGAEIILKGRAGIKQIMILLIVSALIIFYEKYFNDIKLTALVFLFILFAVNIDKNFEPLFGLVIFDIVYQKVYIGILPAAIGQIYFLYYQNNPHNVLLSIFISCIYGLMGCIIRKSEAREKTYTVTIDNERRLRYELEQAKVKLLSSSKEVVYLAEVKERNRIAREIHDSVGHMLTGILMQLQASYKLYDRDSQKSADILKKSIEALSKSITLLRDTVHNLKPKEKLGVEYINNIINDFKFCDINFCFSGDFNRISPNHFEIVCTNIKEALTNVSRHSNATKVDIKIDINELYIRVYIKDNGNNSNNELKKISEGLGLSGMRERVLNSGGSISISSEDGFMIICIIPFENGGGGKVFEIINS